MKTPLEIAQQYFELSNQRNLPAIKELLTDASTYSSANTGVYLGVEQIMEMKEAFYGSFSEMHWEVHEVREERPGVVKFDFTFSGIKTDGEKIERPGIEYVIVYERKIQHVEVRNQS